MGSEREVCPRSYRQIAKSHSTIASTYRKGDTPTMPTTISLCKFVGTISLGLLTGVSYTLSSQSLPSLPSLDLACCGSSRRSGSGVRREGRTAKGQSPEG